MRFLNWINRHRLVWSCVGVFWLFCSRAAKYVSS